MRNFKFTGLAVFLLFFGIALVDAVQKRDWIEALLFVALGILFLWSDFKKIPDSPI